MRQYRPIVTEAGHMECAFVYEPRIIGGVLQWTDRYVRVSVSDAARVKQMVLDDDIPGLLAYLAEQPKRPPCKCSTVEVVFDGGPATWHA